MTKTMRERLISTSFSIGLLFVGALFSHFFWQKETNSVRLNKQIELLEKNKADKAELLEFKNENARLHESEKRDMKEYFDTRFEDLKSFMIELNKRK